MGVEFEYKFRATPEQLTVLQSEYPGEDRHYAMETTYYDTPSGALSQRHYTLRCRRENHISVCTLKTPAPGAGRNEHELVSSDIHLALPELCARSGIEDLPVLLEEGIVPVCGARFTRIAKTIQLDGLTLEMALDQGVLLGGGREHPLCEVEVELKEGTPEELYAFAARLALQWGLIPETRSKYYRAKCLASGQL